MDTNSDRSRLVIEREAFTVETCRNKCEYEEPSQRTCTDVFSEKFRESITCDEQKAKSFIKRKIPILDWLLNYQKEWFMGDAIAGVTMAIIHIPQGLGFAMLANIPPISGLYMAFFPCIVYAMFASSRHCSMGTFAVVTMMTGKVVNEYATFPVEIDVSGGMNDTLHEEIATAFDMGEEVGIYTPFQIATLVTLSVGIWQMIFGFLQVGLLSIFLSDIVISAFTTAAAFHVIVSQIKFILGIKIPFYSGLLKFIYSVIALCKELPSSNVATVVITLLAMAVLIFNNELIKPRLAKLTRIPLPIELITIIIATLASYYGDFANKFDVKIIGNIPTGLPAPSVPPLEMMSKVAGDSFIIAIVSYIINYSIAKIFATKHGYVVDSNQELYAQGLSNIFGSFFSCAPMAVALIRSVMVDQIGGKTQLVSLIAAALMIPMLLWLGPFLEPLPNAVFASIIIVTLKGMVMQVGQLFDAWKLSKIDGITWLVTFWSTIILDIEYGLVVGVIFSLFVLLGENQLFSGKRLGRVKQFNMFLDVDKYPQANEIPGFMIYQISGSLHFANRYSLQSDIIKCTGLDPLIMTAKNTETNGTSNGHMLMDDMPPEGNSTKSMCSVDFSVSQVKYLIIDMSCISSVDIAAGKYLGKLRAEYDKAEITLCLAGMTESVFGSLNNSSALNCFSSDHLFHSVLDAIAILDTTKIEDPKVV